MVMLGGGGGGGGGGGSGDMNYVLWCVLFIFTGIFYFTYLLNTAIMGKPTGHLLRQLRSLMRSKHQLAEAIQAYIIPSEDAHQV